MDLVEMSDVGCEQRNCGLVSHFPEEDCWDQDCQYGLTELVCVTVVYIPLMLFGLLGNILTILVVWLRPHMRSSTYLYLSSMAVSDLLILLLLPLDLYKLWRPRPWLLGDLTCKLTMFLSECCTFCTILHITFLSLERYVAVCWPITAKTMMTRRRTRALIGCLWLGAAVSAAPVLVMVGVEEVRGEDLRLTAWMEEEVGWVGSAGGGVAHMTVMDGGVEEAGWREEGLKELVLGEEVEEKGTLGRDSRGPGEKTQDHGSDGRQQNKMKEDEGGGTMRGVDTDVDRRECRCTDYAVSSGLLAAMMILSNLYFLVPVFILGLVYSLIGRTLWIRQRRSRKDRSHRHTIKMLGVIVLAFVLCWLPFNVARTILSLSLGQSNSERQETYMDSNRHPYLDVQTDGPDTETHTPVFSQSLRFDMDTEGQINTFDSTQDTEPRWDGSGHGETLRDRNNSDLYSQTHSDTQLYFLYFLSQYFNLVSSVLYYLSAAVNPLLYNLMSSRYRHAVHSLVHACCDTQPRRTHTTVSAQLSTTPV